MTRDPHAPIDRLVVDEQMLHREVLPGLMLCVLTALNSSSIWDPNSGARENSTLCAICFPDEEIAPGPEPPQNPNPQPEAMEDRLYRLREERLHRRDTRPQALDEIVGQREALDHVNVLLYGPDPQHMLFLGPPGCGKTTLARLAFEAAKISPKSAFAEDAPFVTIDGATMAYDESNHIGGLTTFVHEAFYGSVRKRNREKDREGVPEIAFGACARAHLGVLFIDEIGELAPEALMSLLKVLEDHKETLTSSSHDPANPHTPAWMREFFANGVPADFVLIGATTRRKGELPPALVSRCEIVPFRDLTPVDRVKIVMQTASKIDIDVSEAIAETIAATSRSGREAARRVRIAAVRAMTAGRARIEPHDLSQTDPAPRMGFRQ